MYVRRLVYVYMCVFMHACVFLPQKGGELCVTPPPELHSLWYLCMDLSSTHVAPCLVASASPKQSKSDRSSRTSRKTGPLWSRSALWHPHKRCSFRSNPMGAPTRGSPRVCRPQVLEAKPHLWDWCSGANGVCRGLVRVCLDCGLPSADSCCPLARPRRSSETCHGLLTTTQVPDELWAASQPWHGCAILGE